MKMKNTDIKNNWTTKELKDIYDLPFNDLLWKAQSVHRKYHNPNEIQISTLMSIKTGGCPEDCKYCSQSIRYDTDINLEKTLPLSDIIKQAKDLGIHANANNSATEAIAQLAIQDPNGIIVVCGSFYSAGKVLEQNI